MSTTIDQRVVEMRFDNRHFEQNVSTTMSTLDKLKQKLHLDGATKGLENVNAAAKGVKMDGLGMAVDTVSAKFSALQVMGVTALANITNSAVNAGKRMVKALTLDPVTTGFKEYETQINATQTILSNTQHKGSTIDDVNRALEELNKYADMTIYNFTEMTRNIGTFTAAGIDLNTSVNAIQGIANLAAVSGSTSQQASTAMYQLSQALSSGTVRLMDWNSVVNAGMGGELFQNALRETSELLGTGAEAAIEATGSFRESLREEWLTAEVLTETLKKFTTTGANEYIAEYTGLSIEAVEAEVKRAQSTGDSATAMDRAAEALAKMSGKSKDAIKETLEFAQNATDAATKVKTFTQLWDVLKESAQSGWAQTWKIIIGDFEEAKNLLTPLADFMTNIINKTSEWRNAILESALGRGLGAIGDNLNTLIKPASKAIDTVKDAVTALENLDEIVNSVINGDWGNGQERFDKLAKAGHNYCKVQNEINKKLNNNHRYTEEQIAAQDKLIGKQQESTKTTEKKTEATVELTKEQKEQLKQFAAMDEAQAKSKGYTDEQIEAMKELGKTADDLGLPLNEFIDNIDQINGRWLLINSFKNIGQGIIKVFNAMKDAWQEIFPPKSIEERGKQLFNIIAAFHKFTSILEGNSETADNLRRTFKGVFAILDVITTILGGGFKIAFKVISSILSYFHLDILDVTAAVGDVIVKFHDWFEAIFDISGVLDKVVPTIQKAVSAVKDWFKTFKETPAVQKLVTAVEAISSAFHKLTSGDIDVSEFASRLGTNLALALKSLPGIAAQIGQDFIAGFTDGLNLDIGGIIRKIIDFCLNIVSSFAEALGVQSPSWKAFDIASDFIQGFINGITSAFNNYVVPMFKNIGEQVVKIFKGLWDFITDENGNIEWGKIFAGGILISAAWFLKQLATAFSGIAEALGGFDDLIDSVRKVLDKFAKVVNAYAWDLRASALQKMAIAIAILVASIWVLTQIDDIGKLWNAVGVIGALAVIVVALAFAMAALSKASMTYEKGKLDIKGVQSGLMQIGIVIALLAASVKLIGSMDPEEAKQGFYGLAGIAVGLIAFVAVMGLISRYSKDVSQFGRMMIKLSTAMLLLVGVIKLVDGLDAGEMFKGAIFAAAFVLFVGALVKVTKSSNEHVDKLGGFMVKMAIAIGLMVGVVKLASMLSVEEMFKGAAFAAGFVLLVKALVWSTKVSKEQEMAKVGGLIMSVSFSLMLMIGVCKLVDTVTAEEAIKGALFVAGFAVMLKALVSILAIGNDKQMAKVAGTILAMSAAIAILAAVAVALSFVPLSGLIKGVAAVSLLGLVMSGMVRALSGAQEASKSIMWMAIAIGIMAAAVVALSFVPFEDLAPAVIGVGILMGMFALMTKAAVGLQGSIGSLLAMSGVVLILAGVVYILANTITNADAAIKVAISLGVLMGALALSLTLIGIVGPIATKALLPMLGMVGILALVAVILGILTALDIAPSIETTAALAVLLLTMTGALAILTKIGLAATTAYPAMAALAVLILGLGALLAALGGLSKIDGFNELIADGGGVLSLIGKALGAFVGSIVAGFAAEVLTILPMLGEALSGFMTGVQPFITGVKMVDESVLVGAGILAAAVIALTAADLMAGFASLYGMDLVSLGTQLSGFITAAMPFITTAATITPEMLAGVKVLADTILILTAADLLQGLASFIGGGSSLESFATQLPLLGQGLSAFSASLGTFSEEQLTTVNCAARAIKTLSQASSEIPNTGGLLGMLVGENDLGTFAAQFPVLGTGLRGFLNNIGEFTDAQISTINCAAQAVKTLAQVSSEIPNTGGLLGQIVGENDLSTFAAQFPILGIGLRGFLDNIGEFTDDQASTVDCAAKAVKTLAQASSEIPNSGGWLAQIVGDNDLSTFASQFPALGIGLRGFLDNVGTLDETANGTITAGANAVKSLATAAANIPNEGGWISKLCGDNNLSTFADNFPALGTALNGFISNIGIFTEAQVATVNAAVRAVNALAELANSDLSGATKHLGDFGNDLPDFASDVADFCSNMPSGESMTSAVSNLDKLLSAVEDIGNANSGCLATFADNLKKIGKNAVDKFVEAFTSSSIKTDLKNAAKTLGDKVIDGIESKETAIKTAGTDAAEKAVDGVETQDDDMESAGKDLGSGLVKGIKSKETAAYNAGYALGQKAVQGEKDGQKSNSPSKLTILAGQWLGEGLVIGIGKMSRQVYNAGAGLGKTATETISSAVSRVADLVNTDIDSQPTIRPVLDLSDVRSGVGAIGGLFAGTNSIGVKANVSAISSMMNERNQNGVNSDVIFAIDKLRKDLSNLGNTTYSINGVTYDDGSNIAEAVKTITRAAIRERRV